MPVAWLLKATEEPRSSEVIEPIYNGANPEVWSQPAQKTGAVVVVGRGQKDRHLLPPSAPLRMYQKPVTDQGFNFG